MTFGRADLAATFVVIMFGVLCGSLATLIVPASWYAPRLRLYVFTVAFVTVVAALAYGWVVGVRGAGR